MRLTPLPNALGVVRPAEVIPVGWFAQPPSLAGQFADLPTSRLAAVMLVMLVAVIGEEKIAATAALTSLGLRGHRGPKRPRPGRKEKPNARSKEGAQERRRKKSFQQKFGRKTHRKKIQFQTGAVTAFSFRR